MHGRTEVKYLPSWHHTMTMMSGMKYDWRWIIFIKILGFVFFFFFQKHTIHFLIQHISSVQLLRSVWLFATPWTAARQASLSITNSWSLLELMSIESVMPSNLLILCCPLLLLPSIFPSIRVFPKESALHIRWPKYWSFSFSISPSNKYSGLIFFRINWFDLLIHWSIECVFKAK